TALLGALVRRPGLVLRLPVVAELLVRVLERRERHAPRALLGAVLLPRGVVGLRERALRLLVRALERAGDLGLPRIAVARRLRHGSPPAARRRSPPPPSVAPCAGARAPSGVTVRPLARSGAHRSGREPEVPGLRCPDGERPAVPRPHRGVGHGVGDARRRRA